MVERDRSEAARARGGRFIEELERVFPHLASQRRWADALGVSEKNIRDWRDGAKIGNVGLVALAKHGGDILYVLAGTRGDEVQRLTPAQRSAARDLIDVCRECLDKLDDVIESEAAGAAYGGLVDLLVERRGQLEFSAGDTLRDQARVDLDGESDQ